MAKNLEPGMNDTQAQADRHGWQTSVNFVVGKGELKGVQEGGSSEVGNPYGEDIMGENYSGVTWKK